MIKDCKHNWELTNDALLGRRIGKYKCSLCEVYSNIGPNFKSNSVFLTGKIKKKIIKKGIKS